MISKMKRICLVFNIKGLNRNKNDRDVWNSFHLHILLIIQREEEQMSKKGHRKRADAGQCCI